MKYLIAAGDIEFRPKYFKKFRGKTAKEIYRFSKGVAVTRTFVGPATYALSTIPKEMTRGVIYSTFKDVGETVIGYISGIGFFRWVYKATDIQAIKTTARVIYNVGSLPITFYCKGVTGAFNVCGLSEVEKKWFGGPVYLFDDDRLWIEKNFTLEDGIKLISDDGGET